jgi:hypothetical protein
MWCNNDRTAFEHSTNGQITPEEYSGEVLIRYVKDSKLNTILDIGTWNGLGSTRCFLLALAGNTTTRLISLESNKDKHQAALSNLHDLLTDRTEIVWGTLLRPEDIPNTELARVFPDITTNSEFARWHSIDIENMKLAPYIFDTLPKTIDFVLFDGGEFTTYFEFQRLFPRCTRFIALDDVNVSKCSNIRNILRSNREWREVEYTSGRNGFSLFKKIGSS